MKHTLEEICFSFLFRNRYYASLLSKIHKILTGTCKTLEIGFTSKGKIVMRCNPKFLEKLTLDEAQNCIEHELLHIVLHHLTRLPFNKNSSLNRVKNIACDIAINQYLKGLPKGVLYPETYKLPRGLIAEEYLELLLKREEQQQNQQKSQSKDQSESEQSEEQEDQQEDGQGSEQEDQEDQGDNEQDGQTLDNHDNWGKIVDEDGVLGDASDNKECDMEYEISKIVKQSVEECKTYLEEQLKMSDKGTMPASIIKSLLTTLKPVVRHYWQRDLRIFVNTVISEEHYLSFRRVNRRFTDLEYILPGRVKDRKPRILLIRDTSGSVFDDKSQQEFLNEMISISKFCEVMVCDCDSVVHQTYSINKMQDFLDKPYLGGGGTAFEPAFKEAERLNVDGVVYLTDTFGSFPEETKFKNKTIWVTVNQEHVSIPFGKHVNIQI